MDLAVRESGTGEVLVVFVHGVMDRGRSFEPVAALLEGECRMRWYDRRGYGAAADPDVPPADIPGHIDDLLTVLDGEPAVVVGHSFGGVIACGAAARAPELVDAVVAYESAMAWADGWQDTVMKELLAAEDAEERGLRMMLGGRFDESTGEKRERWMTSARAFVVEERSARLATPPYDLAAIQVPVVYGRSGDLDALVPIAEHLKAKLPLVEEVVLMGADHHAHRTDVERFAGLVRRAIELRRR